MGGGLFLDLHYYSGFEVFTTTAGLTRYELEVRGSQYRLLAGGAEILAGPLRDYYWPPDVITNPALAVYGRENFLFLGDDTSSASAEFDLGRVSVQAPIAVPEPATVVLVLGGGLLIVGFRRRLLRRRAGR